MPREPASFRAFGVCKGELFQGRGVSNASRPDNGQSCPSISPTSVDVIRVSSALPRSFGILIGASSWEDKAMVRHLSCSVTRCRQCRAESLLHCPTRLQRRQAVCERDSHGFVLGNASSRVATLLAGSTEIFPLLPLPRPRHVVKNPGAWFQHKANSNCEATLPEIREIFYGEEIRDRMLPVRARCEKSANLRRPRPVRMARTWRQTVEVRVFGSCSR
ncbi:hypothetical protein B0G69_3667 [Paraburkholderia sp. RAU2J]|nr:hypothetical protein B0G69_3667 [Paraburkholderia sp. RAU2J]